MIERRREDRKREFERFVASAADELLRTGYLVVWDLAEAEDLVQESLLRVAKRWPRVRSMDHPVAYARRVLINLALDRADRRSRERQELDGQPLEDRADESSVRDLGRVDAKSGTGVTGATLVLADGRQVTTSTANGWFAAWWPGAVRATDVNVDTPSGVTTQHLDTGGPVNCGPGPCTRPAAR